MKRKWFPLIVLAPFAIALFIYLGGLLVMWLWNAMLPPLFGLPVVTFWQAVGLLALSRILFGGWGHSYSQHRSEKHRPGTPRGPFTAEERERIREALRADAVERASKDG